VSISVNKATSSKNILKLSLAHIQLYSEAILISSSILSFFESASSLLNQSVIYSSYFVKSTIFLIKSATSNSFEKFSNNLYNSKNHFKAVFAQALNSSTSSIFSIISK
jgi:hypothetical protein